jgi:drug/metabolite transporter (DMT)-like permease
VIARDERRGWFFGALGMLGFSLTLPMTRIAVQELPPVFVGLGRSLVAASLGGFLIWRRRLPLPASRHFPGLATVAAGVIAGFPLLTSLALRRAPASHGAIVIGILPLATALSAAWLSHERPSGRFWIAALVGSAAVSLFALSESGWVVLPADALLVAAAVLCGLGYAEGGRISRELGGLATISWALVLASPFAAALVVWTAFASGGVHASPLAWAAFGYTGVVSMFLAFWAWYHGMALGGIARVGQLQLLQVFLTLAWAHLLLHEPVGSRAIAAAFVVVGSVAFGRRAGAAAAPKPAASGTA